jgi:hypothetical protein
VLARPKVRATNFYPGHFHFSITPWSKLVQLEANGSTAIFRGGCHFAQNLPAGMAQMDVYIYSIFQAPSNVAPASQIFTFAQMHKFCFLKL